MINIGIVGLGRLGKIHARNLSSNIKGVKLKSACSTNQEELNYVKNKLGVNNLFTDYNEMIDYGGIDAVVIVSPSGLHTNHINYALDAGLHVFSEKPFGVDLEKISYTIKKIKKHPNQVFQLGFMRRYDDSYQYAKNMIDSGKIGDISVIRCYGIDPSTEIESFLKFAKSSNSGGLFLDFCVHDIDILRWFTNSEPVEGWSLGNNIAYPELNELETGAAMLKLKNDVIVFLLAGRNAPHGYHVETEVLGTKGMLRIGNVPEKNLVTVFDNNGIVRPTVQNFPERFSQAYLTELEAFVKSIENGEAPTITPKDGYESTRIAQALQYSFKTGKHVDIMKFGKGEQKNDRI